MARSTTAPSAFDTTFDVMTTMSPSSSVMASAISWARSSPAAISGKPTTPSDPHVTCRGHRHGRTVAGGRIGVSQMTHRSRGIDPNCDMARSSANGVSDLFDPSRWQPVAGFEFTDITYHRAIDQGTVRIAFDRPDVRNAFRPHTVDELFAALDHARTSSDVGVVLLTGNGPSSRDGGWAFCSGGDQRIRGKDGYRYASGDDAGSVDPARTGRLHILECQRLIRFMPKVVICVVPGWAAGGGHSLHVVCDLTLASREHARFKQTDAAVASFDGGFGSAYLARQVGQKLAREIFFLGREYTADDYVTMGAANLAVPHDDLEVTALEWAAEINAKSPTARRMLKYAFNLIDDGLVGQQLFAGEATRLAYASDEAAEGRDAFLAKRDPDWSGLSLLVLRPPAAVPRATDHASAGGSPTGNEYHCTSTSARSATSAVGRCFVRSTQVVITASMSAPSSANSAAVTRRWLELSTLASAHSRGHRSYVSRHSWMRACLARLNSLSTNLVASRAAGLCSSSERPSMVIRPGTRPPPSLPSRPTTRILLDEAVLLELAEVIARRPARFVESGGELRRRRRIRGC